MVLLAGSMAVTQVNRLMIKIYLVDLNDDCLLKIINDSHCQNCL